MNASSLKFSHAGLNLGGIGLLAAMMIAPASASAQDLEALIEAAQAEGHLVVYSSQAESQTAGILAAFEQQYGISGTFLRLTTTPLVQRFATEVESGAPEADVLSISSPTPYDDNPEWFLQISAETVPAIADWPERWVSNRDVVWTTENMVAIYNTDTVSEEDRPQTWKDLIKPRWAGQMIFTDPRGSENYLGWLDAMERAHGMEYLEAISTLNYTLTQSGASGAQMVAAGAQSVNYPSFPSFIIPLLEAGAPVTSVAISEPLVVSPRSLGIAANAPNPNAARLFVHWLLTEDGMRATCAVAPTPLAGDPEGKFGCNPAQDPDPIHFALPAERIEELLEAVDLTAN